MRLRELDGWRAISVLLVIAHHLGAYQFASLVRPHVHLALVFENCGPLGVRVFFVISGFVICRLLLLEENRYGSASIKGFYVRRAFRILPPLCLYLAPLGLLISLGLILESWRGILNSALFLYDFVPAKVGSWFVGHTWSLAVEEQFYLTFPALWLLTRKVGRGRFFLGLFCLLAAWNIFAAVRGWNQFTNPNTRAGFACICFGVVIASFEFQARAIARTIPIYVVAPFGLLLLWHPEGYFSWKCAAFDSIYMPLAIALVLLFSLESAPDLRSFLCWKPVQAIGLTSYGIYLWQQLFTAPTKFYAPAGKPLQFLLPLLFLIVPLSFFYIEKPAMRLGRSLAERVRNDSVRENALV